MIKIKYYILSESATQSRENPGDLEPEYIDLTQESNINKNSNNSSIISKSFQNSKEFVFIISLNCKNNFDTTKNIQYRRKYVSRYYVIWSDT
jgi:hypothetical protein